VVEATQELLAAMIERNDVGAEDIVSIVFTATPDIRSEFPAVAARALGLSDVPLLCAAEMAVEGAMPRCIRVLLHLVTDAAPGELRHVYLRDARSLRSDLDHS
jgi:chorismate mutase